jgi:ankyrin repeat protein
VYSLLTSGVDVNAANNVRKLTTTAVGTLNTRLILFASQWGHTALMIAARYSHSSIVKVLLLAGADASILDEVTSNYAATADRCSCSGDTVLR